MDRCVRFPLNRSVSILIDFDEYDNPQRTSAFVLERKVIQKRGYEELRVRIPKAFVNRVKLHQERENLFQYITQKTYKVFYNRGKTEGKTRVVVMDTGTLKFKGPSKKHTNQVFLKKNTFSTLLSFIDNNFNRDDEKVDEDVSVMVKEESCDLNNEIESNSEDNDSNVEMNNTRDNNYDVGPSEDNISIEDVKVSEAITQN